MTEGYSRHPEICGGKPALIGYRFTVAQLLREIIAAPGISLDEICADYGIRTSAATAALRQIAQEFDKA